MTRTVTPAGSTALGRRVRPYPPSTKRSLAVTGSQTGRSAPNQDSPAPPATISIGLIGGRRLMREATARLIAAQDGLELWGTCDSSADFIAKHRGTPPDVLLVDCDGDTEAWIATLTSLAKAPVSSRIAMLCNDISRDIVGYAMSNRVSGVMLKSYTARDIRDSIAYMNSGHTVLPGGWQETVLGATRKCLTLSPRHRQILRMIAEGSSNEEIADTLSLSPNTVKFHVRALYSRLGVRNRVEAARRHAQIADSAR